MRDFYNYIIYILHALSEYVYFVALIDFLFFYSSFSFCLGKSQYIKWDSLKPRALQSQRVCFQRLPFISQQARAKYPEKGDKQRPA